MIKNVEIKSLEQINTLLLDQERNEGIGRLRSAFFFRGLPDADYKLITSIQRNCGDKQAVLEPALLRNFTKYASTEDITLSESVWKQMIVGQHHGLATRLLDWTHSPLIALHFAETVGDLGDLSKHDCVVWRIDARDVNRNLPKKYQEELKKEKTFLFSVESLQRTTESIQQYDADMEGNAFAMLEPPSFDQRIINQYSFFSVVPCGMNDIEAFLENNTQNTIRYIVSKEIRWDLRDLLDQYNINERVIYPGLDGIAKWVSRHYYVKK